MRRCYGKFLQSGLSGGLPLTSARVRDEPVKMLGFSA